MERSHGARGGRGLRCLGGPLPLSCGCRPSCLGRSPVALDRLGLDAELGAVERVFVYLPLEHSEELGDQREAVRLFDRLAASVPAPNRPSFDGYLDYARRHLAIIERFGRFPHRNAALGREAHEDETAFLQQPGSSF